MRYTFEELEHNGKLYTGEIEIVDWEHEEGFAGVPYNGGQNMPEPAEPERYTAIGWEYVEILDVDEGEELSINEDLTEIIDSLIDWEVVNDELTEYNKY